MNQSIKKLYGILVLALVLAILSVQMPNACSAEFSAPEEALIFLRDVVMLDVSKYNAALVGYSAWYPPELSGLAEEFGKYILESTGSKLSVLFIFRNETLFWCLIDVLEGSPIYAQTPPANVLSIVDDFLQKQQVYTGDSELERMRAMLDAVTEIRPITITQGSIKLAVSDDSHSTSFSWRYTFNDADYTGVQVIFRNGSFHAFRDDRSTFKIGDPSVNISKEEAIGIALKHIENFSWTVDGVEISNFNVTERINAMLLTRTKESLTLYPYWEIVLNLDRVYPGGVNQIVVTIWAGTGEIIDSYALSWGGDLPPNENSTTTPQPSPISQPTPSQSPIISPSPSLEPSPTPTPTQPPSTPPITSPSPQQENSATPSTDTFQIATATIIITVIAIATLALKKKRK
jgi:hypothetical protein